MLTFDYTLTRDDGDLPVVVHFVTHPGYKGWHDMGDPMGEPDEPATIEIIDVLDAKGARVNTTSAEEDEILGAIEYARFGF